MSAEKQGDAPSREALELASLAVAHYGCEPDYRAWLAAQIDAHIAPLIARLREAEDRIGRRYTAAFGFPDRFESPEDLADILRESQKASIESTRQEMAADQVFEFPDAACSCLEFWFSHPPDCPKKPSSPKHILREQVAHWKLRTEKAEAELAQVITERDEAGQILAVALPRPVGAEDKDRTIVDLARQAVVERDNAKHAAEQIAIKRDEIKAERDRAIVEKRAAEKTLGKILERCRKTQGPCWCGVHVTELGDFEAPPPQADPGREGGR